MTNLDPKTQNADIGVYINMSGRVTLDEYFRDNALATWIKASSGGDIVYQNWDDETQLWNAEDGETVQICAKRILTNGTVDGSVETTSATGMFWGQTPATLIEF